MTSVNDCKTKRPEERGYGFDKRKFVVNATDVGNIIVMI
jgi:hypothetical protein